MNLESFFSLIDRLNSQPERQSELEKLTTQRSAIDQAMFDLQLTGIEQFDDAGVLSGLRMRFTYATDLFDESTIALFAARFGRVLEELVTDPGVVIRTIDIVTEQEREEASAAEPKARPRPSATASSSVEGTTPRMSYALKIDGESCMEGGGRNWGRAPGPPTLIALARVECPADFRCRPRPSHG